MFGVSLVEQVVDPRTELQVFADLVAAIERKHAETRAFLIVLADHVAVVLGDAVLRGDKPPQRPGTPVVTAVGQPQAALQWWHLWQRCAITAVLAPSVGQGGVGFPVGGQHIRRPQFASHDPRVDVLRPRAALAHHVRAVVEEDVVADLSDIA
ncbi:hypothetical protein D3C80_1639090 [compost metagenome]